VFVRFLTLISLRSFCVCLPLSEMICNVTCLSCGYNGGGHSTLVSFEREAYSSSGDRSILSRCIVNVGDGTQRFCNENRVKLSTISCIIITSLAPHNIAGFPGVFLSLSDLVSSNYGWTDQMTTKLQRLFSTGSGERQSYWSFRIKEQHWSYAAFYEQEVSGVGHRWDWALHPTCTHEYSGKSNDHQRVPRIRIRGISVPLVILSKVKNETNCFGYREATRW